MKRYFWQSWSIGTRMSFIAMMPVVFLFTAFVGYSWYSHRAQVAVELAERARILSKALAETSEYNVISGNLSDLRLTVNGLVQTDRNIYRIDVVDAERRGIISVTSRTAEVSEGRYYEAPIKKQMVWINLFSDNGTPHVSGPTEIRPPPLNSPVVGYVRVTMSPSNMMDKQAQRFRVELAMAALALLLSAALAWFLARSLTSQLMAAIGALRQIRGGNYQVALPVTTGGEVGELQESINEMSVALGRSRSELENKVAERTKDLVASRNEALKADADKRKLIQKVNSIVEDERKSIAVEIHDELNAALIAARLESQSIVNLANKLEPNPVVDEIRQKSQSITKLTLDLYASGRRLVRRLRPEVLDMLGLEGAVEEMIRHYDESHPECSFEFDSEGDFAKLESELAISAYRIVQEALSNVLKHAKATEARVVLALKADRILHIEVADNGNGFTTGETASGIGIIGMRERVYALGGTIEFASAPGQGTEVSIDLPLPAQPSADAVAAATPDPAAQANSTHPQAPA
jgi:two-component system sensor histidine kinase UhpB